MKDDVKTRWVGRWSGKTVACIASGPSLTVEDCERVHAAGLPTIAVNLSFRRAPWAEVLFAMDARWWAEYKNEVDLTFRGERLTTVSAGKRYGAQTTYQATWYRPMGNSGAGAISLAVAGGASRIILLGYDSQKTGGRVHWHDDYPEPMSNAVTMKMWPGKFARVAAYAKRCGSVVVNCSRETALTCFDRSTLDKELSCEAFEAVAA